MSMGFEANQRPLTDAAVYPLVRCLTRQPTASSLDEMNKETRRRTGCDFAVDRYLGFIRRHSGEWMEYCTMLQSNNISA